MREDRVLKTIRWVTKKFTVVNFNVRYGRDENNVLDRNIMLMLIL